MTGGEKCGLGRLPHVDRSGTIPRSPDLERVSRNSGEGVLARLKAAEYQNLPYAAKLKYVEEYLAVFGNTNQTGTDPMSRQTIVNLVLEYTRLLEDRTNFEEINQLIDSTKRFEANIKSIALTSDPKTNVKGALARLKTDITRKQTRLLTDKTGPLTTQNLVEWASQLDERVIYGALTQKINNAKTVGEVAEIRRATIDAERVLSGRFKRASSSSSNAYRDFKTKYEEAGAVRVLALTRNLETTLDFIQAEYQFAGDADGRVGFPKQNEVFASLLYYTLTHDPVEFGAFHQRMDNPKTAKDRHFSKALAQDKWGVQQILLARRGSEQGGDPLSASFSYGSGRKFRMPEAPSEGQVLFLKRTLYEVNFVTNDLIKTRYSLPQIFDMLIDRSGPRGAAWREEKARILRQMTGINEHREIQTWVDAISDKVDAPLMADDLRDLRASAREIHTRSITDILDAFYNAPDHKEVDYNGQPQVVNASKPKLSAKVLGDMPFAQRAEVFKGLLKVEAEQTVRQWGSKLAQEVPTFEDGLKELVEIDGKVPQAAADEFLAALREWSVIANDFASNRISSLPDRYFVLRRQIDFMYPILEDSTVNFADKLTESATAVIEGLRNPESRLSSNSEARRLLISFLVPDQKVVREYLKTGANSERAQAYFELSSTMSEEVARYEGFAEVGRASDALVLSMYSNLADAVYYPSESTISFKWNQLLSAEEKAVLMPLGPGFVELMALEETRVLDQEYVNTITSRAFDAVWPFKLQHSVRSTNAVEALSYTLSFAKAAGGGSMNEEAVRFVYMSLRRALDLVQNKAEMELFASLFARHIHNNAIGANSFQELLSGDISAMGDMSASRYRQYFYDQFAAKLTQFDAWDGQKPSPTSIEHEFFDRLIVKLNDRLNTYRYKFEFLNEVTWYQNLYTRMQTALARVYTDLLVQRGDRPGRVSTQKFLTDARANTPWSEVVDRALGDYIRKGKFDELSSRIFSSKRRGVAVELTKKIRSLTIRSEVYEDVIKVFGMPDPGWVQSGKNYWKLYRANQKAEAIWTKEVLSDLRKAPNLFAALNIKNRAWASHVARRAAAAGVSRGAADQMLMDLREALIAVETPFGAEVSSVFPEASRHRDKFLEKYVKSRATTYESLELYDTFKSKNTESPYHKISKAMFEVLDEHTARLMPIERAKMALYLSGFDDKLEPALDAKIKESFNGGAARRRAVATRGFHMTVEDVRLLFNESTEEEKLMVFRALFAGKDGLSGHPDAEKVLTDRLLFTDDNMPPYLRKLLGFYIDALNSNERAIVLSALLSGGNSGKLAGPDVLRIFCERGGVTMAKFAQLIASHGFNLPREYQDVLEVFKGRAQVIEKIVFMRWLAERLPPELYMQIDRLGREIGAGSQKIGYQGFLRDGREVAIMAARDNINLLIEREFEITDIVVDKIMSDPETKLDNLQGMADEVKRVLRTEQDMRREARMMIRHQDAVDSRPFIVQLIGGRARVKVPQPLKGWQAEGVIVEEFIKSTGWDDLPERSFLGGWTKESMAKATVAEVLNQLTAYMYPSEQVNGAIVLDIDGHEQNQLAEKRLIPALSRMIDIDLGQSMEVPADVVRAFVRVLFTLYGRDAKGGIQDMEALMMQSSQIMAFRHQEDRERWSKEVQVQASKSKDPIEVLVHSIEEVELSGLTLRSEYLFFQKLFATLVGFKKSISDPDFFINQTRRILLARMLTNPSETYQELKRLRLPESRLQCIGRALGAFQMRISQ